MDGWVGGWVNGPRNVGAEARRLVEGLELGTAIDQHAYVRVGGGWEEEEEEEERRPPPRWSSPCFCCWHVGLFYWMGVYDMGKGGGWVGG